MNGMNSLLPSVTTLTSDLDTDTVTPGVLGFLVIFMVGVGLFFLMRNFVGKIKDLPKGEEFAARVKASTAGTGEGEGASAGDAEGTDRTGNTDGTGERQGTEGDTDGPSPRS